MLTLEGLARVLVLRVLLFHVPSASIDSNSESKLQTTSLGFNEHKCLLSRMTLRLRGEVDRGEHLGTRFDVEIILLHNTSVSPPTPMFLVSSVLALKMNKNGVESSKHQKHFR